MIAELDPSRRVAIGMIMGVDHRVDRGTCPPYFLKWGGDVMCFVPPTF